mmetsp:Transcript_54027/g.65217  ORF Transcript_54027/g.65217 Transcript_54027/m.65217 type:complete len:338 (+) Transcript_54027:115-1128(+)|eukprot:CAMPEP_0172485246 /NCGR_PEP_ID=MMETSP1066-20121228/13197_1 /TAXON_ID=671091 /ORGANISM="Coscinodiscus wailesii, Strain CCMP2513" /LENGTH=337 /DNA_ID=CAMNT_0013250369 /DNA_START=107 /DNA_END=1120 /DNA_ORIENTATION=+
MSKVDEPNTHATSDATDGFAYWVPLVCPALRPLTETITRNLSIDSPEKVSQVHKHMCTPGPTWTGVVPSEVEGIGTLYSPANEGGEDESSASALLYFHGGGRIMGCSNGANEAVACSRIVCGLGIAVLSVEYRLAFPDALDDAVEAYRWLARRMESRGGCRPAAIAVAGESAGGGIAAELCQRLLDEKRRGVAGADSTPACQILIYPMLDDRTCMNEKLCKVPGHLVWNNKSNMYAWSTYLGPDHEPGDESLPQYASASRREDLTDLPPAYIQVGNIELFRDEDAEYTQRLRDAGVEVEFNEVKGAFHGVMTMGRDDTPVVEAWAEIVRFAKKYLVN